MLPRCLAAAKDAVDEMIVVDTGSTDRTVEIAESFGAKVLAPRVDRRLRRRPQRLVRGRDRRLAHLPGRRRGAGRRGRRRACASSRATPGARPSTSWRPTSPATWTTAGRSTTTPCACSATAPSTASRAVCTSRSPTRCPRYMPERLEPTTCASSTTATSASVRDAKEKSRRNIELLEQQIEGRRRPARSCTSTSAPSTRPPATTRARCASSRKSWELLEQEGVEGYGFVPSLVGRLVRALARQRPLRRGDHARDEGLQLFPGFTDLVFEQAHAAHRARTAWARPPRHFARCHRDGRRAEPLLGHGRLRHVPGDRQPGRRPPHPGPRRRGHRCS